MVKQFLNPLFSYSHPYVEALLETFVLLFTPLWGSMFITLFSVIHTLMMKHCYEYLLSYSHAYGETILKKFISYCEALLEQFVLLITHLW